MITTTVPAPGLLRVLGAEVLDELREIRREPAALFFSVLMPVGFFALFVSLFGDRQEPGSLPAAALILATYGTFGVVSVVLLNPGIGVAEARSRGWLRVKKVSAVPVGITLGAKVTCWSPTWRCRALPVWTWPLSCTVPVAGPDW